MGPQTETQKEAKNLGPGGSGQYQNEENSRVLGGNTWPDEVTSQAGELMEDCMNPGPSPHESQVPRPVSQGDQNVGQVK